MRQRTARTLLLATLLVSAAFSGLRAQDSEEPQPGVEPAILLTEGVTGLQDIMNLDGITSGDEDLSTENGPAPGDIPVDGGLSLLLAAGAAMGVRRLRRKPRRKD